MSFQYKKTDGFTIIEMLIVVAIVGILSMMAHGYFAGVKERSRDSVRITDIDKMSLVLDLYYSSCKQYPETLATSTANGCPAGTTLGTFATEGIPVDLVSGSAYGYSTSGAGSSHDAFVIRATLERNSKELVSDVDGSSHHGATLDCEDSPSYYYCIGS